MKEQKNIYFENGHLSDDAVALYADAILEQQLPSIQESVLVHVAECAQCKDKILDLATFMRNPETISASHILHEETHAPRKKWFAYPMRIAALFFTAIVLAGSYFFLNDGGSLPLKDLVEPDVIQCENNKTEKTTPVIVQVPDQKKNTVETVEKQIVKQRVTKETNTVFKTNPTLESSIGSRFRSASHEVFSPRNGTVIGDQVHFKWRNQNPSSALTLTIVNNCNETKIEYKVAGNGFVFKEKDKLSSGLYYWKLATTDDLIYIGKFLVK